MEKINMETIEWRAPEYDHKEKGVDFFWTIGLIALVGAIIAIWKGNYVFGIFIIVSGACLIFFTMRKPEDVDFSINSDGINMGKDKHPWNNIKSFNIKDGSPYSKLMIETTKKFLPIYTLPLPSSLEDKTRSSLLKIIPNSEIQESPSMLFMEKLGF